jgi:surface protein
MSAMFNVASSFNQPLDGWDVSQVTDMSKMFDEASQFNGALIGLQASYNVITENTPTDKLRSAPPPPSTLMIQRAEGDRGQRQTGGEGEQTNGDRRRRSI